MMKKCILILGFLLFGIGLNAQVILPDEPDTVKTNQQEIENSKHQVDKDTTSITDIVYLHDGTKMHVDVKKIYLNDLYYSLSGETKVKQMDQRLVHKIEYKSGKSEVLNEEPQSVRSVSDYRKVKVTYDPDDVDGMVEVAKLEARAEGSERGYSTAKTLERTATIVLRRKAALVNAEIVLITDKKVHVAFGEIPFTILYGTAYNYR
ncbi:MAG: hypothetical protein R6V23_00230 [Bacteroidales bacterium]